MASWQVIPGLNADVQIVDRERAQVSVTPFRKKVAIVGFATNTVHLVPWGDPSFEIWGMNQGHINFQRRAERWFEMHLPEATPDVRDPEYLTWLANCQVPVYMIQAYNDFPTSLRYPIDDAIQFAGRDYFTSSVAFMLALAGMEGFEEIHLYGINLAIGDEYFYEKPCAEWWIGKLEGMGRKVVVPSASALLKQYRRYGYSIDARPSQSLKTMLELRARDYRGKAEQMAGQMNITLGAMRECEALIQIAEGLDRGSDIVLIPASQIAAPPQPLVGQPDAPSTGVAQKELPK